MAKHGCIDGTSLDGSKYSNALPLIGLYIAGATSVCFIFMFYDVWVGLRYRKRWLPCKLFSLNSLTLTLLAVATKLPIDLTTQMPSAEDQLSKLTGTTLICVAMVFFMPSLGTMERSECFSNMAALTIFVITVIVNVCIQISSGAIFTFIVEHIIIMAFLFLLLVLFWCCALEITSEIDVYSDQIKKFLVKSKSSMLGRLELCYVYSYMSDPQLVICRTPFVATVGMVSTVCTVLLSEAVFRSLFFKEVTFCRGQSDYQWSVWIVVLSQIVTLILGFASNFIRWVTLVQHLDPESLSNFKESLAQDMITNCTWMQILRFALTMLIVGGLEYINEFVAFLSKSAVHAFVQLMTCVGIYMPERKFVEAVKEFQRQLKAHDIEVKTWILRKGVEDMNRWMEINKRNPASHLIELFSKFQPSPEQLSHRFERIRQTDREKVANGYFDGVEIGNDYSLSCLSVVVLVIKTTRSRELPREICSSLHGSLDEVFEMICFVENKMDIFSAKDKKKLKFAKEVWDSWRLGTQDLVSSMSIGEERGSFLSVDKRVIGKLIDIGAESSDPQHKHSYVQQLFVDMVNWFLVKLPKAIFKDVAEGPTKDCNERIKNSIEFIRKLEMLENTIQWKFPNMTDITRLITNTLPGNDAKGKTQVKGSEKVASGKLIKGEGSNGDCSIHEIQEIPI